MNTKLAPAKRTAFIATLLIGTFSMSISQSSLSTAYPAFMRTFHLGSDTVAWLTTGFMLVMTLMIPVSPWLLHNVPFKRLFQAIEIIFALGTALCVWAPSFTVLMSGRLLEAVAVGVIFPSYQTVLLAITSENQRGSVMGTAGLVMGSALAVGPIISGVLLTWFPWQALFIFFLLVALCVLAASTVTIQSVIPHTPSRLDWVAVILVASFPLLLYTLTVMAKEGLTPRTMLLLIVGLFMAVAFISRELRGKHPMLQLRVFTKGIFTKAVLMTGISYIALIVTTILMPLYFQTYLHVTPLVSGVSLVPAAVMLSIMNPISGRMLDAFGPRRVSVVGMVLIVVGFGLLAILAPHLNLFGAIMLAVCTEVGNAFVMMPAVTAGANDLPAKWLADGTAVTTTCRQLFGSAGVLLATVALTLAQTHLHSVVGGFAVAFGIFAVIGVAGLLLAMTLPGKRNAA
ncbi:MFS transporter [Lacticaseibacillus zhaodongensis]|uniref:MFS transporter n=1 Tax=Lacticaseibacillus zhaodongensis TaxID=2668065 RepID=UPI0012D33D21|nr:MFS transporter [Lacticaseibacillus zhaodongensis]